MSSTEQRVPALDMGVLEAVERKQSFTKKMSKKIKNLVTPRSKPGSPTGHLSNSSSSASLIRVPSIPKAAPKPAAPEPAKPAAAPKAEEPAAEAVIPIVAADVSAAIAEPAPQPAAAQPAEPAAEPAPVAEPAPAEPAPVVQAQPAAEEKQADAEAGKPRGASPFRPLFTVALLAAAAGAAIVLGGSGAAAKAPAGKRGSWRNRQ